MDPRYPERYQNHTLNDARLVAWKPRPIVIIATTYYYDDDDYYYCLLHQTCLNCQVDVSIAPTTKHSGRYDGSKNVWLIEQSA